jgi:hypothetical protein
LVRIHAGVVEAEVVARPVRPRRPAARGLVEPRAISVR